MGKPFTGTIAALATASCLLATGAQAATSVGNECAATGLAPPFSFVQMTGKAGGMPIPIPESGVITSWRINAAPFAKQEVEYLKVMHPTGNLNEFVTVGESQAGLVNHPGVNSFSTRIAVRAGDHLGVFGTPGAHFCLTGDPGDAMGAAEGNPPIGTRKIFVPSAGAQLALAATVEPDADIDGYGDETQDRCPQNAAVQVACPLLLLDAVSQAPGKRAVRILVASSSDSVITVSASAKLPAKAKRAGASAQARLASISQLVTPGKIAAYTLKYTKALKHALKALPRKRSLKLQVTAVGKSLTGADASDKLTVKLRGQAKP